MNEDRLSAKIKEATKKEHLDLEKKVVRWLKAIDNKQDYAEMLRYFHSYYTHLERAMAPYINETVLPDHKKRRNSEYLKHDIVELREIPFLLTEVSVPEITNTLEALGALYVMEGSVMGGRILVKMLAKKRIAKGVSFFSGYGEDTPSMWKRFQEVMDRTAVSRKEQETVVQKARETFACFSGLLDRAPIPLENGR